MCKHTMNRAVLYQMITFIGSMNRNGCKKTVVISQSIGNIVNITKPWLTPVSTTIGIVAFGCLKKSSYQ